MHFPIGTLCILSPLILLVVLGLTLSIISYKKDSKTLRLIGYFLLAVFLVILLKL